MLRNTSIQKRLYLLQRITLLGFLSGIFLSWNLWVSDRSYPLISAIDIPYINTLSVIIISLFTLYTLYTLLRHPSTKITTIILTLMTLLVLGDILRWQPWVYIYLLVLGIVCFSKDEQRSFTSIQFLLCSVYVWSGIQKLNAGFMGSGFPWLVEGIGIGIPDEWKLISGLTVAIIEIFLGVCLAWRPLRKCGVCSIVAMHVFILLCIGPLGHNYNSIVWPWNIAMMLLVVVAFWNVPQGNVRASKGIILLTGVLPIFSFFGYWPNYFAFSLYSGNEHAAYISVPTDIAETIPHAGIPIHNGAPFHLMFWTMHEENVPPIGELWYFRMLLEELCNRTESKDTLQMQVHTRRNLLRKKERVMWGCTDISY